MIESDFNTKTVEEFLDIWNTMEHLQIRIDYVVKDHKLYIVSE